MRDLPLVVAYVALFTAVAAGGSFVLPTRPAVEGVARGDGVVSDQIATTVALLQDAASVRAAVAADAQGGRLADRARVEALLADARPPVPMLPSPKPVFVPVETAAAPATADQTVVQTVAVLRPPSSPAKSIEADGYRGVRLLGREADGRWRALALRGATEVAVLVDDQGNVATQ
jgi:hypothetical protein